MAKPSVLRSSKILSRFRLRTVRSMLFAMHALTSLVTVINEFASAALAHFGTRRLLGAIIARIRTLSCFDRPVGLCLILGAVGSRAQTLERIIPIVSKSESKLFFSRYFT